MSAFGIIWGLDLATRTGFACGAPGCAAPRSGTVILKRKGEGRQVAFANLIAFLGREWSAERPALVVKEASLSLEAFKQLGMSEDQVRLQFGLHSIVEGLAVRFGVPIGVNPATGRDPTDSTIRKHFLGIGKLGTRAETKAAVITRCRLLKMMPDDGDDDRADAIATFDWACAHLARSPARAFAFFGQQPRNGRAAHGAGE